MLLNIINRFQAVCLISASRKNYIPALFCIFRERMLCVYSFPLISVSSRSSAKDKDAVSIDRKWDKRQRVWGLLRLS